VIRSISPQKIAFWRARLDAQTQSGLMIAEFYSAAVPPIVTATQYQEALKGGRVVPFQVVCGSV